MKLSVWLVFSCAIAVAPSVFADFYVTSRDGGFGDLYRYTNGGAFIAKYPGNGLNNGQGVVIGPNGNLLVVNESGSVLQYNPATGAFISVFATVAGPGAITVGPDNNVYVGSGGTVVKLNGTTGASMGTFASGGMLSVAGVAFGPNGNLFVTDGLGNTVKQFNGTTGAFVNNFATSPGLNSGAGPLIFYNGNLLVAQAFLGSGFGNSILKFDQTTGASLGNFASDSNLNGPDGLIAGPDGNLYVANYNADNVLKYSPTGTFLGVFANVSLNGAAAPTFIAYSSASRPVPGTPAPPTLVLLLVGMTMVGAWPQIRRLARARAMRR